MTSGAESARRLPLRLRLTLWFGAVYLVLVIGLVGGVAVLARGSALGDVDRELEDTARLYAASPEEGQAPAERPGVVVLDCEAPSDGLDGPRWLEREGLELAGLMDHLPVSRARAFLLPGEDGRWVVAAREVGALEWLLGSRAPFVLALILSGGVASLLAAWVIIGRAVAPLRQIAEAARAVAPDSLEERIEVEEHSPEVEQARDELNRALDRLEAGYHAQERFLSNVSHELRTPITVVLAEAQLLSGDEDLRPEARQLRDTVLGEMSGLGRVLESFLTLARAEHGPEHARVERLSVHDVLVEATVSCDPLARTHEVRLVPLLSDPPQETVGDPRLLQTLFENLLRNAIHFAPSGSSVRVSTCARGDAVEVDVVDDGPAMPPEMLGTIFERYGQDDEERERSRGAGLGLAIARSIVDLHQGEIRSLSGLEHGCVVRVLLPLLGEEDWRRGGRRPEPAG